MNFFEKTLKTPSIPTTDLDVKEVLEKRELGYIEADAKIKRIAELMKEEGISQEEAFERVINEK